MRSHCQYGNRIEGTSEKASDASQSGIEDKDHTSSRLPSECTRRSISEVSTRSAGLARGSAVKPAERISSMTRSTDVVVSRTTLALSVAKLTLASTPSRAFSCRSIRAAQAPQVIPPTLSDASVLASLTSTISATATMPVNTTDRWNVPAYARSQHVSVTGL